MGKMYTLQPDESINDHVKESMEIIDHIVELSIGCMRDLANPHEGTFVDMTFNKFMRSLEHIRESIQMLDDLTDEMEDDNTKIRHEYEEKVIQFFNRFMNSDLSDEYDFRMKEVVRNIHEIENHYMSEIKQLEEQEQHWHDIAVARTKEIDDLSDQIADLTEERDYYQDCLHKLANRASNFCGNCKHFKVSAGVGVCERLKGRNKYKVVDPDDASCSYYCACYCDTDSVKICKPEFPCCEHCSHDDCDNCTLCPF